jgi:Leucine-rich repeat (LRR) protein
MNKIQIKKCYPYNQDMFGKVVYLHELDLGLEDIILFQLVNLVTLKRLNLSHNNITDISSLEGLVNLEHLYLPENNITDILALSHLNNLETLVLHNNEITDVSLLGNLKNLKYLSIRRNYIVESQIDELRKVLPNCEISY